MNDLIAEILLSFKLDDYRPIVPRDLDLGDPLPPRAGNLVKVITGMRRSGKSYRLFQEMDRLDALGISWDRICYFNFEDDRLAPITSAVGDAVLDVFLSLHPQAATEGFYLFLDEVQEMQGWGAWLRRVIDTTKATIYVSGSSSTMLSQEIASELRGRSLDFELLPYSFGEYVRSRGGEVKGGGAYDERTRRAYRTLFQEYLERGGFPAAVDLPESQAIALLQSYVQRVVARDVVERHNIARPRVASLFAQRALASNAMSLSVRRVVGDLKAVGYDTSRELLSNLLAYYEEAYLLFTVREFSYAQGESARRTSKVYAIDPGLAMANARANSNNLGQRLENAVYLELRRRAYGLRREGISYHLTHEHGYEVDFAVGDALLGDATELYQVCVDMADEKTRSRECRALFEALDEAHLDEGTLIVAEGEARSYERGGRRINQIPAWRWFIETTSR